MLSNPRFPHSVVVKRTPMTGDSFNPTFGDPVTILSSECRNSLSTKGNKVAGVLISKYVIALPVHDVSVLAGDDIYITDTVRTIKGIVVESVIGNIGANIYYDEVKG